MPTFGVSGSGGFYLANRGKSWARSLLRMLDAHDRRAVSTTFMAKHLAETSAMVHRGLSALRDNSVGPSCTVSWLFRPGGRHGSGGGHQFFSDATPENVQPRLLSADVSVGFDPDTLVRIVAPSMAKQLKALLKGELYHLDHAEHEREVNEEYNRISPPADEKLK